MRKHRECPQGRPCDGSLGAMLDRCGHYYLHRIKGGNRGQGGVMAWLDRNPNATQKELGEAMGITPASLSEVLMKLEHKGFVTREKDGEDRRLMRVALTPEGKRALDAPETDADDPFQALSASEQESLAQLLGKLLADWEPRYPVDRRHGRGCPRRREEHAHGHRCGEREGGAEE